MTVTMPQDAGFAISQIALVTSTERSVAIEIDGVVVYTVGFDGNGGAATFAQIEPAVIVAPGSTLRVGGAPNIAESATILGYTLTLSDLGMSVSLTRLLPSTFIT